MSTIDPELLKILACPETRQPLAEADAATIQRVNTAVGAGTSRTVGGEQVAAPLAAGLVREDKQVIYPIRDGIPVLLVEEGIRL